jgi:hypothetical protein
VRNLYSDAFVEKLHLHVAIDETELEQSLRGQDEDAHEVCIRGAEASVKIADADVKRARAARKLSPSSDAALDLQRAELVAEIATLNLERAKNLDDSEAALTHLQWQIDELRHQVLELQLRR